MPFTDNPIDLNTICHRIADGRRLSRLLATAIRKHPLSEAEFRLLWMLRETGQICVEQSTLVERLGLSPAQVSALVEKLRSKQVIALVSDNSDRRRKRWRLTASGRAFFETVCASVGQRTRDLGGSSTRDLSLYPPQEDVA